MKNGYLQWQNWKEMSLMARTQRKSFQNMTNSVWWIIHFESLETMK